MPDSPPDRLAGGGPARERTASQQFTFRGNLAATRHGWLRLTPAYSVHLVRDLLDGCDPARGPVLDPFCGTGTTLVACAERGLDCTTVDLNPFLVWLARAKTARYAAGEVASASERVLAMSRAARARSGAMFVPDIHNIERWWDPEVLPALARAAAVLRGARVADGARVSYLTALAFCRAVIEVANVSFGHQSMSFRKTGTRPAGRKADVAQALERAFEVLAGAAGSALPRSKRRVVRGDSRAIAAAVGEARFGTVVTSPPYSNRMSYIRELRPYMYWLGYLTDRKHAGELDWRAIGGTWGAATSRLGSWRPDPEARIPFRGFDRIVKKIAAGDPLLGSYVHRYFEDMSTHCKSLARIVSPGGRLHYVVGNSKFYDVMLPAHEIFAALFEASGFRDGRITVLRTRTSKKELFEYLVEATMPGPKGA
jgi:SAM-dependent methyltransferase